LGDISGAGSGGFSGVSNGSSVFSGSSGIQ
jgi:hypothetical protein